MDNQQKDITLIDLTNMYKTVFSTSDGKEVLKDILKRGKLLNDVVLGDNEYQTIANAGKQALAHYILNMVGMDVDLMLNIVKERSQKGATNIKTKGGYSHV